MSRSAKQSILATFAIVATISVPVTRTAPRDAAVGPPHARAGDRTSSVTHSYLGTPLRFERRTGTSGDFIGRGIGYAVSLSNGDATVALGRSGEKPETIAIRLAGRRGSVDASTERELPGRSNQLIGNDPRLWRTGIPAFARVAYHDVYPGIDLVYYGTQQQLEYDFVLRPGASPADIAFDIAGAREVRLDRLRESRDRHAGRNTDPPRASDLSGCAGAPGSRSKDATRSILTAASGSRWGHTIAVCRSSSIRS